MAQPIVGQVLTFAGNFAPAGYLQCAGQSVPISQYETLYNLIGTTYGGDGVNTFNLPDLRSRVPIHMGSGPGLSSYAIGQSAGVESVTLAVPQMPPHTHPVKVVHLLNGNASVPSPTAYLSDATQAGNNAAFPYTLFPGSNQVPLAAQSVTAMGGSQAHENRQPFLALTYCIAIYGVYPSRS